MNWTAFKNETEKLKQIHVKKNEWSYNPKYEWTFTLMSGRIYRRRDRSLNITALKYFGISQKHFSIPIISIGDIEWKMIGEFF